MEAFDYFSRQAPEPDAKMSDPLSKNPDPLHSDRKDEREAMVREQLEARGITSPRVLQAMRAVPRHEFVPVHQKHDAYADSALPIGCSQTISQPYIVALMSELANPAAGDKILEIGTGSGYQAAVLAEMDAQVYSLEILDYPYAKAKEILQRLGYANRVILIKSDGYWGWPEAAPYDIIMATCAVPEIPKPWLEQLKPSGRIILPLGQTLNYQTLTVVSRNPEGALVYRDITGVVFVPMTGSFGFKQE